MTSPTQLARTRDPNCETCTRDNYRLIYGATKHSGTDSQWECIGITHSGEADETETCANCNCILWELQS